MLLIDFMRKYKKYSQDNCEILCTYKRGMRSRGVETCFYERLWEKIEANLLITIFTLNHYCRAYKLIKCLVYLIKSKN